MSGHVYAIRCGDAVKIGYAARPGKRLSQLNVGSPLKHTLIGFVKATREQEAELHCLLSPWCIRGEWFDVAAKPVAAFCNMVSLPPIQKKSAATSKEIDVEAFRRAEYLAGSRVNLMRMTGVGDTSLYLAIRNGVASPRVKNAVYNFLEKRTGSRPSDGAAA